MLKAILYATLSSPPFVHHPRYATWSATLQGAAKKCSLLDFCSSMSNCLLIAMCYIQQTSPVSDLRVVWWSSSRAVAQSAVTLPETWHTDPLLSEVPARHHFVHTLLCLQSESCCTVYDSAPAAWAVLPGARSPAQWCLQVYLSVLWWTTKFLAQHLYMSQHIMCGAVIDGCRDSVTHV